MQILGQFGFEPILFFAQIVNFFVIFFILKKFLYKPMLKMLEERKQRIAEGLKNAEEAEKHLQETLIKEEQIVKKAQEEARKMIEEAKAERDDMLQKAEVSTKARVDAMLQEARQQIAFETGQAEKRIASHVSRLAVQFLEQTVQDLFGPQEQELIMKNAMKKLREKVD